MTNTVFEIKRSISFFLEKRKDKTGALIEVNVPIRMSVSFGGNRVMFFAGYRVDAAKWDAKRQRAKNNTTHGNGVTHSDINDKLDRCSSGINSYFKACEVKRLMPTLSEIKEEFARIVSDKAKRTDTFYTAFDEFVKTVGKENDWGPKTYEKFSILRRHLVGFDANLTFEKLNADLLVQYIGYLRNEKENRNTTISKNMDFVKWFLKWAAKNNYPVTKSALDFKPKLKGADGSLKKVIFLSLDELKHLYTLEIEESKGYLQRVRDVFVFCCFSGLRYSDVYNLKKSDDKGDCIEFVTQKTSDLLRVELNKYSRAILDKYKEVPLPGGKALPVITNQKMNEYLKELGKLAEFNDPETIVYFRGSERIEEVHPKHELLSTHCARKTFVTNLIYMGVSDHVIRQWTGHRDSKSFDAYHRMVNEIKAREMSKFDNI